MTAPEFCTMPVAVVPPRIVTWLLETTMSRSRFCPQGPEPRVRDWIEMPFTLFATTLSRTCTFDEVLMLIPPLDQVVLIPPDSQSAIQKPSVLFPVTSLPEIVPRNVLYCPTPSWPLWWI